MAAAARQAFRPVPMAGGGEGGGVPNSGSLPRSGKHEAESALRRRQCVGNAISVYAQNIIRRYSALPAGNHPGVTAWFADHRDEIEKLRPSGDDHRVGRSLKAPLMVAPIPEHQLVNALGRVIGPASEHVGDDSVACFPGRSNSSRR